MKKIQTLCAALLFGAAHLASAGSTNIYVENWGTGQSGVAGNPGVATVGWIGIASSFSAGPYLGIYANGDSPVDSVTGAPLPVNTVYFTFLTGNQTLPGMIYTTSSSGSGVGGNSTFTNLDPTQLTNLTLNLEVAGTTSATNFFAVEVGGAWYVSTTPMVGTGSGSDATFTNNSLLYTNLASAWDNLTLGTTNVTIGTQATGNLNGPITGIGIVELPTTGGWDYNQFTASVFAPNPPPPVPATITTAPTNQTVYAGGGAQFIVGAAGTQPIIYAWQTNSVTLVNGSKYAGATTNLLTISNCNAGDGTAAYSVSVTNVAGGTSTNGFTLTVQAVPAGYLYAETYPWIGPSGNLSLASVGWANASSPGATVGIFQNGVGLGAVFDYSPNVGTNLNYTTDTNDTGFSGLPFVDINPASYPAVTFQASFTPGNGQGTVTGAITAYWAVQMTGGLWYSSVKPIPINTSSTGNYLLDQLAFKTVATNWNTLTVNGTTVTIGNQASVALAGSITGAGIIMIHNDTTGASMNWQNFAITTSAVTQVAPTINTTVGLFSQSVATGGGASFAVAISGGSLPITYSWALNGVKLSNGGRISGADTPTLTIANCTTSDSDPLWGQLSDVGNVVAYVSNSIGVDASSNYIGGGVIVSLQVTNPPVGQLYSERYSYVGPSGNQPLSLDGWTEAVPSTPNVVFFTGANALNEGFGAAFAYLGSAGTTVYYTTSANDTNQAGVPFPAINTAFYPNLSISVDIAPNSAANVTAYLAVQFGANWYVAANPLPVPGAVGGYVTYTTVFNPAASNWKNITVTGTGGIVGSPAASNLTGTMTGAGLVFVTVGAGGDFNFQNFVITGTGLGGINVGTLSGNSLPLSWLGNPAVNLQSTTSLNPSGPSVWVDVPNTLGLSATNVSVNVPKKFFRLVAH